MTLNDAFAACSRPGAGLPRQAMQQVLDHWDEARPRCAALLDACASGRDRSEGARHALFITLHLQAQGRDTWAYAPLCRRLLDAEAANLVLGDAVAETLRKVLAGVHGGDPQPLASVAEAEDADEFIRSAALDAMAYLTRTGGITEGDMRSRLLTWLDELQPRDANMVWGAWVMAVAHLGHGDLAEAAEGLLEREFVDPSVMDAKHFRDALRHALDDPASLDALIREGTIPFESAVAELGGSALTSAGGSDAGDAMDWADEGLQQPCVDPLRGVGRNGPRPCGGGRKYKGCCPA